jgi:hypothetical protein
MIVVFVLTKLVSFGSCDRGDLGTLGAEAVRFPLPGRYQFTNRQPGFIIVFHRVDRGVEPWSRE